MPNIKSAIKRVEVTKTKTLNNTVKKSALKTVLKKCHEAIEKKEDTAKVTLTATVKALDKAAARNLLHKNTAARRKSRFTKALNAANK